MRTFKEASNVFQFAPCFSIASLSEGQSLRDAFWGENYCVSRGNLSLLPEGSDRTTLFGYNPDVVLLTGIFARLVYSTVGSPSPASPFFVSYTVLSLPFYSDDKTTGTCATRTYY